jgi:hypothetical protein
VGNAFVAARNIRHFTPKHIAKGTAKSAGNAVIEDHRKTLQERNHTSGAGPSFGGN